MRIRRRRARRTRKRASVATVVTFTKQHGRQYRYYLCHQANRQGYHACPVKTVSAGIIEGAVMGLLNDVFRSPEMVARTLQAVQAREAEEKARLDADKQRIENELAQVRAAAIPLVESLKRGKSAFVREELDGLEARRAKLECELASLSAELSQVTHEPITRRALVAELTTLENVWDNLFPGEQRRIVRLLVDQVTIHPDSIEIALATFGVRSLIHEMQGKDGAVPDGCSIDKKAGGTVVLRLPMRFKKRGGPRAQGGW